MLFSRVRVCAVQASTLRSQMGLSLPQFACLGVLLVGVWRLLCLARALTGARCGSHVSVVAPVSSSDNFFLALVLLQHVCLRFRLMNYPVGAVLALFTTVAKVLYPSLTLALLLRLSLSSFAWLVLARAHCSHAHAGQCASATCSLLRRRFGASAGGVLLLANGVQVAQRIPVGVSP